MQLAGGLWLKMLKYCEVILSIFEFYQVIVEFVEIVESWLVYGNNF